MKFIDTSWWVAWSLPGQGRHREALAMVGHLGTTERALTTNLIVVGTWTFLSRKAGQHAPVAFLDRIDTLQDQAKPTSMGQGPIRQTPIESG